MYLIILTNRARKDLKKLPIGIRSKVESTIAKLINDPHIGKRLKGRYSEYRSIRVGVYRVIYRIGIEAIEIYVITVAHRQGVYKDI